MKRFALVVAAIALAGCGSSGPSPIGDGMYKALVASDGSSPAATLSISGDSLAFDLEGATITATLADQGDTYTLCRDGRAGSVRAISQSVTIGSLNFEAPAMYGDCGLTAPKRVTIVDVASVQLEETSPFTVWIEMCDTSEPDC